jgi:hypothetical protein
MIPVPIDTLVSVKLTVDTTIALVAARIRNIPMIELSAHVGILRLTSSLYCQTVLPLLAFRPTRVEQAHPIFVRSYKVNTRGV